MTATAESLSSVSINFGFVFNGSFYSVLNSFTSLVTGIRPRSHTSSEVQFNLIITLSLGSIEADHVITETLFS